MNASAHTPRRTHTLTVARLASASHTCCRPALRQDVYRMTVGLFGVFTGLAVHGLVSWRRGLEDSP